MTAVVEVTAVVVLAVVAVLLGSPLTTWVFRVVDSAESTTSSRVTGAAAVLRGGRWIGFLERAGVFLTILAGWPEGVALVVAIKGLGRYGELRTSSQGAAERFIIGSFVSLLFASGLALAARWLVTLA